MTPTEESLHRGNFLSVVVIALLFAVVSSLPSADAISSGTTAVVSGTIQNKDSSIADSNSKDISDGKRRGKVLEEPFDEHDLLRAYEEIKTEYHKKAFGGSSRFKDGELPSEEQSWKLLTTMNPNKKKQNKKNQDDDDDDDDEIVRVSMLEHPSDPLCPYVKMETVMPMSVEKCWDFLSLDKWDETMPKMDPFYEGLDIYGEYSVPMTSNNESADAANHKDSSSSNDAVKMILARKRTKRILAFGKREFVFVSVEDIPLQDGTWVSGTVSVQAPEGSNENVEPRDSSLPSLPRRNKSYTRAFQDSIAFYKPLPAKSKDKENGGRTRVTIVCRIDLNDSNSSGTRGSGGCIPMWLYVKTIGITGAKSVMSMRKCLLEGEET